MTNWYADDLTYIHDVGFGGFATRAAPGLLRLLERSGVGSGLVVDLGCGGGRWAQELSRRGYAVLGVDISSAMVRLARRRVRKGEFRRASFLTVRLPRCDAVTSLGECFNYMFDGQNNRRGLVRLFRRVHGALRPGGVFVFDMIGPGGEPDPNLSQRHRQGRDWAVLLDATEDRRRRELRREITTFRKTGRLYRKHREVHCLKLYSKSEIAARLRQVGFRVRFLKGYGRMKFGPGHAGFLARKP